ncbi:unnamed protein product, partial [Closterium sp. NIES-54]
SSSASTKGGAMGANASATTFAGKTFHDFTVNDISGNPVSLSQYKGKVVLVVNVASQCGLTDSNYKELQSVYDKLKDRAPSRPLLRPSSSPRSLFVASPLAVSFPAALLSPLLIVLLLHLPELDFCLHHASCFPYLFQLFPPPISEPRPPGLEILAFPCNQFGSQEPGSNEKIKEFACSRYRATFPLFDKVYRPITLSLAAAQGENGVATEVPKGIEQAAAAGNLDKFEGTTIVSPSTDSMLLVDVKKAGWNAMKCHKDLGAPGQGACTPANCSKGGIPAKWKTSNLLKNKLGVEMYVKGNPLTLKKASPQTCCNTCASFKSCTYWQYIPDITIDGKKTEGACYLVHDNIDYSCGELTAQYATDSKPIALQVRTGGECNPAANVVNDPHLVGAFGTHFDFNGRPDKAFCLLTDRDLHVNMLLRGYYSDDTENAALVVDGKAVHTWIKELGLVWFANGADHKLRLAARGGKQQERGEGFMKTIEIDGEEIPRMAVGDEVTSDGGLTLRFAALEKEGPYDVDYYTLAIDGLVSLDLRLRVANPKLQTPNDAEAHINVGIVELEHTDDVHGVLGQTYRPDHAARAADFQRLIANLHRPISSDSEEGVGFLDGTPRSYESSSVLSVDCAHTEYHRAKQLSPVEEFPREPLH